MKINKNNYEAFLLDYIEGNLSAEKTAELLLFIEKNPELNIDLTEFNLISANENESISFENKNSLKRKEFVINDDVIESLIISLVNGDLSKEETSKLLNVIGNDANYKKLHEQYQKTVLEKENILFGEKVLLKGHLPISNENLDYYLIAELENTLTVEERKALEKYKLAFPGVKQLEANYASTKLNQKEIIVFKNKSSLKKKETVVISLYSFAKYASVAAAACLILYFSFFTNTNSGSKIDFSFANNIEQKNDSEEKLIANENNSIKEKPFEDKKLVNEIKKQEYKNIPPKNNTPTPFVVDNTNAKKDSLKNFTPKEPQLEMIVESPSVSIDTIKESPFLHEKENIQEDVALNNTQSNTNIESINEDDYISPGQYVRNWAKKTFFTEKANEKFSDPSTELADNTLQLKGTNLKVKNAQSKDYKEYGFSIGKFSFNRKVRK